MLAGYILRVYRTLGDYKLREKLSVAQDLRNTNQRYQKVSTGKRSLPANNQKETKLHNMHLISKLIKNKDSW